MQNLQPGPLIYNHSRKSIRDFLKLALTLPQLPYAQHKDSLHE